MPEIPIIFNGKLNLDDNLSLLGQGDFIDALNITRDQVASLRDLAVSNLVSNRLRRTYALPSGTNIVIGAKADVLKNRIYYFVWNSNGIHRIEYYDFINDNTYLLLEDDPSAPVLSFNRNDKIYDADIIYRDEGDLLYWNQKQLQPRKINIAQAQSGYYSPLLDYYVEVAKRPPLLPPSAEYLTDTNIVINNVKGKAFEFAYRYIYDDFERSTFSPLSNSPLPAFDYNAALNPRINNGIRIIVNTGPKTVTKIEVAFRYSIGNDYSDYSSINIIDKEQLGLGNDVNYVFTFANDAAYPPISLADSLNYYDWVPRKANAQCLANGNYMVYGGITEGYNGLQQAELNVTAVVQYTPITLPSGTIIIGDPSFTFVNDPSSANRIICTVGANVTPGDVYNMTISSTTSTYTAVLGDDRDDVANYFVNELTTGYPLYQGEFLGSGEFRIQGLFVDPQSRTTLSTEPATASGGAGSFYDRILKFGGKYRLGIIYFDEQGRVIGNPVNTYVTAPGNLNDFEVEIAEFYATPTQYIQPSIELTVRHLPPQNAKSYSFLITNNLLVQSFFEFKAKDFKTNTNSWWISLDDYLAYSADNTNFSSSWTFQEGDRLKMMYKFNGANASGWDATYNPIIDAPINGVVKKDLGDGEQTYIKIQQYSGVVTPTLNDDIVFEVYRPSVKSTESQQIYYEFGQTYLTEVIDGTVYHTGQTDVTNPTYTFSDGDVYIRIRSGLGQNYLILDPNFSDFYPSANDSKGRTFVINQDAKETYNPVLVRFSQAYQFGTDINGLSTFYEENFDEYNRAFGDITKLSIRSSFMQVFQKLRIGRVGVFQQMLKDQAGNDNLTISDRLLNTIVYYQGDYGLGAPESFATNNYASYGCDNIRGVIWRLSLDGIEPISIRYKVNSFATEKLPLRTGNVKIYGTFNAQTNKYEFSLEEAPPENAIQAVIEKFSYSHLINVSNTEVSVCGGSVITVYTGVQLISIGVVLYVDEELTIPLTGYDYVSDNSGNIYTIDNLTGEILTNTGNNCNNGIAGSYRTSVNVEDICPDIAQIYYTDIPFAVGAFVYLDAGLSTPLTGFNYIASGDSIYNLDSLTGEVGADTGSDCDTGDSGLYVLGNDSGTICAGISETLYTSGAFAIGKTLYYDSSLLTNVTGFSFVLNISDLLIYDLDPAGEILSATGLGCENMIVQNNTGADQIDAVNGFSYTILTGSFPIVAPLDLTGIHDAFATAISVDVSGPMTGSDLSLYKNGALVDSVSVGLAGTYSFNPIAFTPSDQLQITYS